LTSFEKFICERENFAFDSLIYLEPVQRFKNGSNVMKFRNFGDITSSRVKDKLKTKINENPTTAPMFPGSGNTDRLLGILYYVWACRTSKMATINWKQIGNYEYHSSYT